MSYEVALVRGVRVAVVFKQFPKAEFKLFIVFCNGGVGLQVVTQYDHYNVLWSYA